MRCAWQEYLKLLPIWMRRDADEYGKDRLQELRLRTGQPPRLILQGQIHDLARNCKMDDIAYVMNSASQYSPWSASTVRNGYITSDGGHRIGICGEALIHNGILSGIKAPTSLCIRVARDFPGIAKGIMNRPGSVLIIGPPGCGKTTLLRDLIRQQSNSEQGSIGVVDERGELFPVIHGTSCFDPGNNADIITGCSKSEGVNILLRTMGPAFLAVDEITEESDCKALINAGRCGVTIFATAHAACREDLISRPIYRPIVTSRLFDSLVILHRDKTWRIERI